MQWRRSCVRYGRASNARRRRYPRQAPAFYRRTLYSLPLSAATGLRRCTSARALPAPAEFLMLQPPPASGMAPPHDPSSVCCSPRSALCAVVGTVLRSTVSNANRRCRRPSRRAGISRSTWHTSQPTCRRSCRPHHMQRLHSSSGSSSNSNSNSSYLSSSLCSSASPVRWSAQCRVRRQSEAAMARLAAALLECCRVRAEGPPPQARRRTQGRAGQCRRAASRPVERRRNRQSGNRGRRRLAGVCCTSSATHKHARYQQFSRKLNPVCREKCRSGVGEHAATDSCRDRSAVARREHSATP